MAQEEYTPPQHISFILDGNRRFARNAGIPQLEGHRRGYANVKTIAKSAILDHHIPFFTAFCFSTENWNRAEEEVKYLMDLLFFAMNEDLHELHDHNIRIRFLGSRDRLSEKILKAIDKAEEKTKNNTAGTLGLCVNYGGQLELTEAFQRMLDNELQKEDITPEKISEYLYVSEIPPIDIFVRTSGEQRLSNYQLWRLAYAELFFVEKHWPAFTPDDLADVLEQYKNRHRRFGN